MPTQQERSATTRARLLAAAVECLVEQGYAATTIAQVQDRADASRGSLLHHFPTKAELMVAATVHVVDERIDQLRAAADRLPPTRDRLHGVVDLVWHDLDSPAFLAALELWVAARTDTDLREKLIPEQGRLFASLHAMTRELLGPEYADDTRTATLVELSINLLTGLAMSGMLLPDLPTRQTVLRRWKRAMEVLLGQREPDAWVTRSTAASRGTRDQGPGRSLG